MSGGFEDFKVGDIERIGLRKYCLWCSRDKVRNNLSGIHFNGKFNVEQAKRVLEESQKSFIEELKTFRLAWDLGTDYLVKGKTDEKLQNYSDKLLDRFIELFLQTLDGKCPQENQTDRDERRSE